MYLVEKTELYIESITPFFFTVYHMSKYFVIRAFI